MRTVRAGHELGEQRRRVRAGGPSRHRIDCSLSDDAAACFAAFGTEIDDPVGIGDHIEVVLDHHDGVARVDEPVQHADQLLDVGHVQPDGRLVENVERLAAARRRGGSARRPRVDAHFRELAHELDPLRLAARERRALLAERQIAEPDVLQQRQRVVDRSMRGEEIDRLVDAHPQDVADRSFRAT